MTDSESEEYGGVTQRYIISTHSHPMHIVNEENEFLCGARVPEKVVDGIELAGRDNLQTVQDHFDKDAAKYALGDFCKNCRRVLLSESDDEELQAAWEERKERMGAEA